MVDSVVPFPKKFKQPPITIISEEIDNEFDKTHHEQTFEYTDGSYIILVLPKDREFTIERMVFMAERLKRAIFDYEEQLDDEDVATVDDPNNAS